ncbi:EAL domain-containing protein [Methylobacter sp.]|uniref:EAL domain-containing protein n=1 Tax=Methylobacter sp. TaxID=2051955 RepID=UPI0011FDF6DF|nr:EAL domain-containing protein [Methylobacter sp.]TAK64193.1 MAG: EAL domain-containing protein [Methylobacter sp.]
MLMPLFRLAILLCLALCSSSLSAESALPEKVSLQLKWLHSFQFAGYYAAKEKGYYAEENLDVTIRERIPGISNIEQVLKDESQYGVADTGLLEQRLDGKPLVVLASIFQHSPLVYLTLKDSGIDSPYELRGKRVMEDSYDNAPLLAMLYEAGISTNEFTHLENTFNPDDLINGKTDAMVSYLTDQVDYFKKKGIEINIINPRNYGVDFLSDNLFTTEQEIDRHPERVRRFLRASLKGWDYALKHQDELIRIILDKYNPENRLSADHLRFEAQVTVKMILPETVTIGHTDIKRFQRMADTYRQLGLISSTDHLDGFVYGQEKQNKLNFTLAEKAWLQAHPVIRVGVDRDFAPYEWIDAEGNYVGLSADYIALVEQRLGVKLEIVKDKSWAEILEMAQRNQLDMLSNANKTPERELYLNFTEAYLSTPAIIISDSNNGFIGTLDHLDGKQVTLEKSYFMQELLMHDHPEIRLILADDVRDALSMVSSGKADAYIGDAASANYVIKREGMLNLGFSGDTHYKSWHRMAATKANPELASILAKALANIPEAEKQTIQNRWMSLRYEPGIKTETVLLYAAAALLPLAFIVIWNVRLQREIRKRKQVEEAQRMASSVFASTQEGILITDAQRNIIDSNPAFTSITGYSRDEVLGAKPSLLKSGLHDVHFYENMWKTIKQQGYWRGEVWNRKKGGEIFAEWLTISAVADEQKKITHYIGTSSDITQLKEQERKLELIAHYDPLTGVPNRLLLADRMHLALAQTRRDNCSMAVGYLDLDGFKPINDRLGHAAGDQLLIEIARRIKNALREGDTIARLGGDEFVFLLLGLEMVEDCEMTLHRLLEVISAPVTLNNQTVSVSASIGISIFPDDCKDAEGRATKGGIAEDNTDPDTLLRHADQAMYQAKQAGKNCFHIYNLELDRQLHEHREALNRIGQALEKEEFELFFQPKIDMQQGVVFGAEALIRWRHPERGLVMPGDFLPLLEHHELATKLDAWVIDKALEHMENWHNQGLHLQISVNISARSLQTDDFVLQLYYAFERYPATKPAYFELEILENQAISDLSLTSRIIKDCQALGVQFALDDFGTGYSSLNYLRHLAVETLKIDQTFVRDMLVDEDDLAIVHGVIGLAESFRREIIAEGVESIEHGIALLHMGCHLAQGYGIAKPMPAPELAAWVQAWQAPKEWKIPHPSAPV